MSRFVAFKVAGTLRVPSASPRIIFGVLTLAIVSCDFAVAQSPWRWKFSPGDVLRYDIQQQSQTDSAGAGKPSNLSVKMTMRLSWTVEKNDEQGGATIRQTVDQISTTMQMNKLDPIVYDSASASPPSGPAKEIGESVKPILGAAFTLQVNARGEVVTIEPSKEAREALEKVKGNEPFTAEGLLRLARQTMFILPEQAVSAGATWEATSEVPSRLGQLEQTTRYTYGGPADRNGKSCEKIDFEAQVKLLKSTESKATIQENEQKGTLWFDAMAGRLVASDSKQRLVTEVPYREMKIRVQTTTTSMTTLVEK